MLYAQRVVSLKGHTRGGRPEIVAMRPSPIVVNYLVFAGTDGFWPNNNDLNTVYAMRTVVF